MLDKAPTAENRKDFLRPEIRKLTYQGETLSISEWSTRTGIHVSTIKTRLRAGWSIEDTLGKRTEHQTREVLRDQVYQHIIAVKQQNDGIPPTIPEIAENLGMSNSNVYACLRQLKSMGLIEMGEKHTARDLRVKGGKWTPPKHARKLKRGG